MLHETFSALGDPTRFAIVEKLLQHGELSAGELGSVKNVSAPAISRHLKILRQTGIIDQKIDRQRRIYSVRPEAVRAIHDWVDVHRAFWEASFASTGGGAGRRHEVGQCPI